MLDTEKNEWLVPELTGEEMQPRMGHTAHQWNTKIVIFGGWNGFKVLDDIVFLDI